MLVFLLLWHTLVSFPSASRFYSLIGVRILLILYIFFLSPVILEPIQLPLPSNALSEVSTSHPGLSCFLQNIDTNLIIHFTFNHSLIWKYFSLTQLECHPKQRMEKSSRVCIAFYICIITVCHLIHGDGSI